MHVMCVFLSACVSMCEYVCVRVYGCCLHSNDDIVAFAHSALKQAVHPQCDSASGSIRVCVSKIHHL